MFLQVRKQLSTQLKIQRVILVERPNMFANAEAKLAIDNFVDRCPSLAELLKMLQKLAISPNETVAAIYHASASFENFAEE